MDCQFEDSIEAYLKQTFDPNPNIRCKFVRKLCPCKVKKNVNMIWERLFEMIHDPNEQVRYNIVHTLCDGSPKELEERIISSLTQLWNDPNKKIKRKVRTALGEYYRTGNWNVL
jgi:vesicle coat complex subunit